MTALFIKMLNLSIKATLLIGVCILIRFFFRKMPKSARCILWLIVGLRLIVPFSFESKLSLLSGKEYISSIPAGIESEAYKASDSLSLTENDKKTGSSVSNDTVSGTSSKADKAASQPSSSILHDKQEKKADIIFIMMIVWAIGVAAVLLKSVFSYLRLRRRLSDAVILKKNVYQSDRIATAFVLGIIRPRIYVPYGLSRSEMYMVLNHERSHIVRKDHLVKPFWYIIAALYWYNPAVWISYYLLCKDIELACDEKVITKIGYNRKTDYSQTLLNLSIPSSHITACPVAFGETGTKERIKNILQMKKTGKIITVAAFSLCAAITAIFFTIPNKKSADAKNASEVNPPAASKELDTASAIAEAGTEYVETIDLTKADKTASDENISKALSNVKFADPSDVDEADKLNPEEAEDDTPPADSVTVLNNPSSFIGNWRGDTLSRVQLSISPTDSDTNKYSITIRWNESYNTSAVMTATGTFNKETNTITYTGAQWTQITLNDDGSIESSEELSKSDEGEISITDDGLILKTPAFDSVGISKITENGEHFTSE